MGRQDLITLEVALQYPRAVHRSYHYDYSVLACRGLQLIIRIKAIGQCYLLLLPTFLLNQLYLKSINSHPRVAHAATVPCCLMPDFHVLPVLIGESEKEILRVPCHLSFGQGPARTPCRLFWDTLIYNNSPHPCLTGRFPPNNVLQYITLLNLVPEFLCTSRLHSHFNRPLNGRKERISLAQLPGQGSRVLNLQDRVQCHLGETTAEVPVEDIRIFSMLPKGVHLSFLPILIVERPHGLAVMIPSVPHSSRTLLTQSLH